MAAMRRHTDLGFVLGAGAVWFLLATNTPTSTFHFAPVVVAGIGPVARRLSSESPLPAVAARMLALRGVAVAVSIGLLLWWTDALLGPDLWGGHNAEFETLLAALLGGGIGRWWSTRGS